GPERPHALFHLGQRLEPLAVLADAGAALLLFRRRRPRELLLERFRDRLPEDDVLAEPLLDLGPDALRPAGRVHLDREPPSVDRERAEHRVLPALVQPVSPLE